MGDDSQAPHTNREQSFRKVPVYEKLQTAGILIATAGCGVLTAGNAPHATLKILGIITTGVVITALSMISMAVQ